MPSATDLPPDWWPHREASRVVAAGGLRWHLQHWPPVPTRRPLALLLHGTGAATHTWRDLAPALAEHLDVVAPDLPGHGWTGAPPRHDLSLPGVAASVRALLQATGLRPQLIVGHSAGAAVACRLALDGSVRPAAIVALNGALLPPQGPVGRLFSPAARLLAANPLVAPVFAGWAALPAVTRRLIDSTGSRLDPLGERCYRHLVADAGHAGGALRLMAAWQLEPLQAELPHLPVPLRLVVGEADSTLPPAQARRVQALLPAATLQSLPGLGHLAHEEAPARVAALCLAALAGQEPVSGAARRRGGSAAVPADRARA